MLLEELKSHPLQVNQRLKALIYKNWLLPVRVSTALVAATCDPSIASSKNKSMGSQRADKLVPWTWLAEDIRDPEAITAWNSCPDIVLHSLDRSRRVSDVNCRRVSGVMCFEFLKTTDFAESSCTRWMKPPQCDGLQREKYLCLKFLIFNKFLKILTGHSEFI